MLFVLLILLIIAGFSLLIKGADFLVRGSSSLAKRLGVSEMAIGLTIVAFGTSMPELVVNILSSMEGRNEIVFGNIIGSNILNLLFILGIAGIIQPLAVKKSMLFVDVPYSLLAASLLLLLANDSFMFNSSNDILSRIDGIVLLCFFTIFLVYMAKTSKDGSRAAKNPAKQKLSAIIIFLIVGFFGLFIGGKLIVDNSVEIARSLGVTEKLIALTIIAAGTSLPELATSAVAAYKKEYDLSIGNIIGSNIFNIFFILGVSAVINPAAYLGVLNIDLYVLIAGTLFLFGAVYLKKAHKLGRFESFVFLIAYFSYFAYLLVRK